MARLALLLGLFLLALAPRAQAQGVKVTMSASSNRVAVGEPFAIEIRVVTQGEDVEDLELPDFGELQVLGRSTSRPFSFSFGFGTGGQRAQVRSETVYGFTLRATEPGAYSVRPAIAVVEGRRLASQSLTITVLDGASAAQARGMAGQLPGRHEPPPEPPAPPEGTLDGATFDNTMFLRTVVDKKRVYLGEQVTVTVYLYVRGQIGDSPAITREPTLDGFWSHDLLPMQRSLQPARQEVNGRMFNAYVLRRYAAFPLRAGMLTIGQPEIEVGAGTSIFDLLTGPSQPLRRAGVPVKVEALALPPHPTAGAAVHTGSLTLEASLDASSVKVGEAATLTLRVKGRGNVRGLTLALTPQKGLDVLAPELSDQLTNELDQLGGERVFKWLILARAPGSYDLPGFVVDSFDPSSGTFTSVRSRALRLTVQGSADDAMKQEPKQLGESTAPRFGPLRPESALRRATPGLAERPFFWPLVLAAPLLLLAVTGLRHARRARARQSAGKQDERALREVEQLLGRAEQARDRNDPKAALGSLASALKKALEARLGEPIGGLTSSALDNHLRRRGMPAQLAQRVVAELDALERARFSPLQQDAAELSRALAGVRATTGELARFSPRKEQA